MNVFIPSKESKKYSSLNKGDLFGNLVRTKQLDFNKKGYLSLGRKPHVLYTETQDADFEVPVALVSDDDNIYVITTENMFEIDPSLADYDVDERVAGTPPTFGFQSDGCFFQGILHASGTTMVCSFAAASWTSRITGMSSSYPHPLCVSEHQQYLAVGNGNTVRLYDAAYSLVVTCTVPNSHVVEWIRWRGNLLYFGTRNTLGGDGRVYLWNGSGTAAQAGYSCGSDWAFSGCEYGSTIAIINSIGQLLQFAGDGFIPIRTDDGVEANFPVYNTGIPWGSSASTSNLIGKVASRGMEAKGRRIYMVVNGEIEFTFGGTHRDILEMPSGLWVFDPDIGLYHKCGAGHKQRTQLQPSSVAANVVTLPSSVVYETGDPISVDSVNGLTGDIDDLIYYAIKVSSTTLKLAATPQQALAGDNITITGTPNGFDLWSFNTYQSVGATRIQNAGGINIVKRLGMPRFNGIEVVFGVDAITNLATAVGAVMSLGMGKSVGSFTTPKIQASNVTDLFKKLIAKFPPLNIPSRKIIIKYREANRWGVPGRRDFGVGPVATWVNATSFTVNPKVYDMYSVIDGDEVEFLDGAAAGYTAHITNIAVNSATQWTITIDESMPDVAASDVSHFVIDNWTKYKVISTADDAKAAAKGFKNMALAKNAKWIQLKVELRGYVDIEESMDMEELMLVNGADQKYA